jgi:hypothetical protein
LVVAFTDFDFLICFYTQNGSTGKHYKNLKTYYFKSQYKMISISIKLISIFLS